MDSGFETESFSVFNGRIKLKAIASKKGIVCLYFQDNAVKFPVPDAEESKENKFIQQVKKELGEYFAGRRKTFDVAIDWEHLPGATDFRTLIRKSLISVPFGSTMSYQDFANVMGKHSASGNEWHVLRAIGGGLSWNPIVIVIPCHRIISKSGKVGGYQGGPKMKKLLIDFEKQQSGHNKNNSDDDGDDDEAAVVDDDRKDDLPKCKYGDQCYRKSKSHREQYWHPKAKKRSHDDEEEEMVHRKNRKIDRDLPECPYGSSCYRKNPDHRKKYKH